MALVGTQPAPHIATQLVQSPAVARVRDDRLQKGPDGRRRQEARKGIERLFHLGRRNLGLQVVDLGQDSRRQARASNP